MTMIIQHLNVYINTNYYLENFTGNAWQIYIFEIRLILVIKIFLNN